MATRLVADPSRIIGKPEVKTLQPACWDGKPTLYVPMAYGSCSKWDGSPEYSSWYA